RQEPRRGAEDDPRRHPRERTGPPPLPQRGADRRLAEAPRHRADPRRRHHRRGPAVLHDGVLPRRDLRLPHRRPAPGPCCRRRGPAEAARAVASIADAIQAAHDRGVIHRHLEPGNVLLSGDGTLKVADFGLAPRQGGARLTASGAGMGTPAYVAPEQAKGKKDVGPACDVWALGAILYECLTGRPPFLGETPHETVAKVICSPVPPMRARAPGVPRQLEAICRKCLEKEPAKRYGSAKALANDLRRFLAGGAAPKAQVPRPSPSRSLSPATWIPAGIIAVVALLVCASVLLRPFLIDAEDPAQRPNEVVVEKEGPDRDQHDPAKEAHQVAMKRADDAMKARMYAEAVRAYDEALEHRPGDEAAIA